MRLNLVRGVLWANICEIIFSHPHFTHIQRPVFDGLSDDEKTSEFFFNRRAQNMKDTGEIKQGLLV
jgi:hypothetical protein